MSVKRRRHSPEFKFKVALAATKEQQTINQLSSELSLHPTQISDVGPPTAGESDGRSSFWRRGKPYSSPMGHPMGSTSYRLFRSQNYMNRPVLAYAGIGRLKMELEWLKKKSASFS